MKKLGLTSDAAIALGSPVGGALLGGGAGVGLTHLYNKLLKPQDPEAEPEDMTEQANKARLLRGAGLGATAGGLAGLLPAVGLMAKGGAAGSTMMDDRNDHHDQIPGGLADKKKPGDFSKEQIRKGIKVEMEHTDDRSKAREIAMDHLTEDPKYYDKLETIEPHHKEDGDKKAGDPNIRSGDPYRAHGQHTHRRNGGRPPKDKKNYIQERIKGAAKEDAPNYRKSESAAICGNCAFSKKAFCTRYYFKVKEDWTCDAWAEESDNKTAAQYGVNPIHDAVDAVGQKGGVIPAALSALVRGLQGTGRVAGKGIKAVGRGARRMFPEVEEAKMQRGKYGHRVKQAYSGQKMLQMMDSEYAHEPYTHSFDVLSTPEKANHLPMTLGGGVLGGLGGLAATMNRGGAGAGRWATPLLGGGLGALLGGGLGYLTSRSTHGADLERKKDFQNAVREAMGSGEQGV